MKRKHPKYEAATSAFRMCRDS